MDTLPKNNTSQSGFDEPLETFVEKLMQEKGYGNLDQDALGQIRSDLLERLEDRINIVIIENLPVEKLEEFNGMLDTAEEEDIKKFCQENIPGLDEMVAKTMLEFRDIYLNAKI